MTAVNPPRVSTRKWAGRRRKRRPLNPLAWTVVGLFGAIVVFAVGSWIFGGRSGFLGIDRGCGNNAFGCSVTIELLATLFALALAFVYFTSWRVKRVIGHHLERAGTDPWRLVPTATEVEKVVGRRGLCEIIERELVAQGEEANDRRERSRPRHRPQVIVAGVGDGKTAVLVRLTKFLFDEGAIPVPIALRDAKTELDFIDLARKRFTDRVGPQLISSDEGDKVWRELCAQRLIVILADGLDEALQDIPRADRAKAVRLAIAKASDENMPLVIATRPDPVLAGIDVATIRLEPLPAHRAVDYITEVREGTDADAEAISRIAGEAEVMERPLYLKLARELNLHGELQTIKPEQGRIQLRLELLERWRGLLIDGRSAGELLVNPEDRENAMERAQEMACIALANDKLEIGFEALAESPYTDLDQEKLPAVKVLAGHAEHLDLLELVGEGVRFRHSIMQAYLGSRHLPQVLDDGRAPNAARPSGYLEEALVEPGRELIMALVMLAFFDEASIEADVLCERLCSAAEQAPDHTSFELIAAAYEVHRKGSAGGELLEATTCAVWESEKSRATDVETNETKQRAIVSIAEAGDAGREHAYRALWRICRVEDSYVIRFHAAQSFGGGGNDALGVVLDDVESARTAARERLAYSNGDSPAADSGHVRTYSLLGWVMPLLVTTCDDSSAEPVRTAIVGWVKLAGECSLKRPGMHLGVEAALAQGFKWAANRRADPETSASQKFLIRQALDLLEASRWWQTKVALLQALGLWALDREEPLRTEAKRAISAHRDKDEHPFVHEAASLSAEAVRAAALADRKPLSRESVRLRGPSRRIWIDEVGVMSKIGPKEVPSDEVTGLRVPPAAGWYALTTRAGRLLADTLVLLNLIEGPQGSIEDLTDASARTRLIRDRELRRLHAYEQGSQLPSCLARAEDREQLAVSRSIADERDRELRCGGDGCGFGLCPYPPRRNRPFRGELGEIFCREQERLLRGPTRRLPTWDAAAKALAIGRRGKAFELLTRFWEDMEERDQDLTPGVSAAASRGEPPPVS